MEKHLNTPGEIMNMLDSIVAVDPIKDSSIDYNHNQTIHVTFSQDISDEQVNKDNYILKEISNGKETDINLSPFNV